MQETNCLCGSSDSTVLWDKTQRESLGTLHSVVIRAPDGSIVQGRNVICNNCGLVYLNPRMSQHELDNFYRHDYRKIYHAGSREAETIHARNALALLKQAGMVTTNHLDVGCSTGAFIALTGGCGIEPNEEHCNIAKEKGLNVQCVTVEEYDGGQYDLVTMMNALEHVTDPVAVLTKLRSLLTDNGRVMVSVPNLYGKAVNKPPDAFLSNAHLYSFGEATLTALFLRCGLLPVAVATVVEAIGEKLYMLAKKAKPVEVEPSFSLDDIAATQKRLDNWDKVWLMKQEVMRLGFT